MKKFEIGRLLCRFPIKSGQLLHFSAANTKIFPVFGLLSANISSLRHHFTGKTCWHFAPYMRLSAAKPDSQP